jgi:ribosomal protein S18 acetylase RimI-like enzyme
MTITPADCFALAELATLFQAGYEGYFVPVHVDESTMRFMVDAWDIDLSRSRVVEGMGVCNLGVRGDHGWIGGLGVVPGARRQGVGRALMEAVLEVAPPTVSLEVIEENEPAIRLYEQLGFETTRLLEVWSLPEVAEVEARAAATAPLGQRDLPWQRADESLPVDFERWEVDGGAILIRGNNVLQLDARDEDAAVALLSRGRPLSFVNVPDGDVASAALARLGGTLSLRQLEMRLTTASTA